MHEFSRLWPEAHRTTSQFVTSRAITYSSICFSSSTIPQLHLTSLRTRMYTCVAFIIGEIVRGASCMLHNMFSVAGAGLYAAPFEYRTTNVELEDTV